MTYQSCLSYFCKGSHDARFCKIVFISELVDSSNCFSSIIEMFLSSVGSSSFVSKKMFLIDVNN